MGAMYITLRQASINTFSFNKNLINIWQYWVQDYFPGKSLWECYSTYLFKCRAVSLNSKTTYIFIEIVELYKNTTEHNVTISLLKNEPRKYRLLGSTAFMDKLRFKTQFSLPQDDIS